jgi:hypothetical protein
MPRAKKRRRGAHRRTGKRTASSAPTGSPIGGALDTLTTCRDDLAAQRSVIEEQIANIDQAIRSLGGTVRMKSAPASASASKRDAAGRRTGPTGFRRGSVKEHITRILGSSKRVMTVKEVTAAVRKSGYKTKNKTLAKSVGIALASMPNVKKVGRGQFKLA